MEKPGFRDPDTWDMRVVDPRTEQLATHSPFRRTVVCSKESESEVLEWIRTYSSCCACAALQRERDAG